ncbi:hypothetical protein AALO_G00103860 [Alosa alosa]|uniref:Uncharacterized protein n=1 Tax=Alosa alosa TaxID=278164 RepID=A0AAV6GVJ7_9TELE|nr:hypothetical protein AALO_G00103860 [Alosa alosa]
MRDGMKGQEVVEARRLERAGLPPHWRDVRDWSIEKRQCHRAWVHDVQSLLNSMAQQLSASLERYPRPEYPPGTRQRFLLSQSRVRLPPISTHHLPHGTTTNPLPRVS